MTWLQGNSRMADRVREHDWAATPLGSLESWSSELRTSASLVLDSAFPMALIWGPEFITIYNDAFVPILGNKPPALGSSFAETWAEVWDAVGPIAQRAYAGEASFLEDLPLIVERSGEPEQAYFTFSYSPVRSSDGQVVGMIDTVMETTRSVMARAEQAASEERQRLLVAELQHRVRNILTVVRSVFSRTAEGRDDLEHVVNHFKGRLDSLARTQLVVTQSASGLVDLESMVRDELLSVGAADGPDLRIIGPDVLLPPRTAELIGLAVHELTTNALKYGALSEGGGKISVRWTVAPEGDGPDRLDLVWEEQEVPAVALQPARRGFGRELIEEALPYSLGASTALAFRGGGIRCSISLPLRAATGPE